ncbi:MAG TPA: ATP-binding protein, partial [Patescibacteria group bacterium]|nr:ATP-binding protein [Patescibacteria group bacterium]
GRGIEADCLDKVFVLFQRLHPRDSPKGTGIGLSVCRKLVEKYGGRIWVESVLGEGSAFFFTLPSCQLEAAPPSPIK